MNKKTKKLILIIVTSVLAATMITVGTIYAVKYIKNYVGDTVVSFTNQTALAGDTVKMPFSITKNHGLWGGQIIINYDATALEFISCANGDLFDECEVNYNNGSVYIIVNQTELENVEENGLIATLNFKIKEISRKGNYEIVFDDDTNFCDIDGEIEEVVYKTGTITVK